MFKIWNVCPIKTFRHDDQKRIQEYSKYLIFYLPIYFLDL